MSKWKLKAVVQKTISFLPYKEKINFFFQKYVSKGVHLDDVHFQYKLEAARDHLRFYQQYGPRERAESTVLELGTGWYPIVPTIFFLCDFQQTVSIDISHWMTVERQLIAFKKIIEYADDGRLAAFAPEINPQKLTLLRELCAAGHENSLEEINQQIKLRYLIMDATRLDFPNDHFEFICSNNTFEHVYEEVLRNILREFDRVVKPAGVMSHFIDLSDHFAHMDSSINIYNFLQYSQKQWNRIDNSIQPQNRLRWKDYLAMYAELGIEIKAEDYREGSIEQLQAVAIHPEYKNYSAEELAISHGYIIS